MSYFYDITFRSFCTVHIVVIIIIIIIIIILLDILTCLGHMSFLQRTCSSCTGPNNRYTPRGFYPTTTVQYSAYHHKQR
jgi:hypothetical protein